MSLESLTRAINSAFKVFRMQADAGQERFGNRVNTFSNAMIPHCRDLYGALATNPATKDDVTNQIAQRCLLTADSVMSTSTERLENGNEPRDVFSLDRAAVIAVTETSYHVNIAKLIRARIEGKKLGWRIGGKACKVCKIFARMTVKPGKPFVHGKVSVLGPPAHPSCKCSLKRV